MSENVKVWSGNPNFGDILADILGLAQYFSKPIFVLKPWAQASCFEYHEAYKPNKNHPLIVWEG